MCCVLRRNLDNKLRPYGANEGAVFPTPELETRANLRIDAPYVDNESWAKHATLKTPIGSGLVV